MIFIETGAGEKNNACMADAYTWEIASNLKFLLAKLKKQHETFVLVVGIMIVHSIFAIFVNKLHAQHQSMETLQYLQKPVLACNEYLISWAVLYCQLKAEVQGFVLHTTFSLFALNVPCAGKIQGSCCRENLFHKMAITFISIAAFV